MPRNLVCPHLTLLVCDEAHRTTGVTRSRRRPLPLRPDSRRRGHFRARKRLYMTATPRIYLTG